MKGARSGDVGGSGSTRSVQSGGSGSRMIHCARETVTRHTILSLNWAVFFLFFFQLRSVDLRTHTQTHTVAWIPMPHVVEKKINA